MKRVLISIVLGVSLTLVSCGSSENITNNTTDLANSTEEVVTEASEGSSVSVDKDLVIIYGDAIERLKGGIANLLEQQTDESYIELLDKATYFSKVVSENGKTGDKSFDSAVGGMIKGLKIIMESESSRDSASKGMNLLIEAITLYDQWIEVEYADLKEQIYFMKFSELLR